MNSFEGLPDITESITKVIQHYDESLERAFDRYDLDHIGRFVDAWLQVQKEQAIRLYYEQKRAKTKISAS